MILTLSKVNRVLGLDMKAMRITAILFPRDFKKATGADIAKISAILGRLFDAEESQRSQATSRPRDDEANGNFDPAMTGFLQRLTNQPVWTRAELEALAGTLDLLLDGTIESCNERALEAGNALLIPNEDPVTIDPQRVQGLLV